MTGGGSAAGDAEPLARLVDALAGRVGATEAGVVRTLLAEGWVGEAALALVETLVDVGVGLGRGDHSVLAEALQGQQQGSDLLYAVPVVDAHQPVDARLARVYDGLDAEGVPVFGLGRAVIEGVPRARALAYLRAGTLLCSGDEPLDDVVERRPAMIPNDFLTDGSWIWHAAVVHHLEHHGFAVDTDLLSHVASQPGSPAPVGTERLQELMHCLLQT